jgi:hypothetical protein
MHKGSVYRDRRFLLHIRNMHSIASGHPEFVTIPDSS